MPIGIIKNKEEIVGECSIETVTISYNKTETVVCDGTIATANDRVIYICSCCNKRVTEGIRRFRAKKFREICKGCSTRETCLNKYGVESTNHLPEVKRKQQDTDKDYVLGNDYKENKTSNPEELSELRSKITSERWANGKYSEVDYSTSAKKKWENEDFRSKMMDYVRSERHRTMSSNLLKKRWKENPDQCLDALIKSCKHRFSKFHKRIEEFLNLKELGFLRDAKVGRFIGDEVNFEKKIIIEANGDYVHANPKKYKPEDIILLPGNKYTAQEKWDFDRARTETLESLGFKVIILWESDSDEEILNKTENYIY